MLKRNHKKNIIISLDSDVLVDNNLDYYLSDTEELARAEEIVKLLEAKYKEQEEIYNYHAVEYNLHDHQEDLTDLNI